MDETLALLVSLAGPASMVVVVLLMRSLSKRLGAVTRRPPIYRWFTVSAASILLSMALRLVREVSDGPLDGQHALLYDIPFAVGLLIAVVVAWRYWGWLLYEHEHTDM